MDVDEEISESGWWIEAENTVKTFATQFKSKFTFDTLWR